MLGVLGLDGIGRCRQSAWHTNRSTQLPEPVVGVRSHNVNDGAVPESAAKETRHVDIAMLMLRAPNLCTGVLWNVTILVCTWKASPPQLSRQVVHHLVVMLCSLPAQRRRARGSVMPASIELLPTTSHSAVLLAMPRWRAVRQGQAQMNSNERPPEGVPVRAPVWPLFGILGEVHCVRCVVVQPRMRSRRADVGRAGLLLLEECRVLSTVARGQRLSWLLRKDHHGTEHGGRHRREFGFE